MAALPDEVQQPPGETADVQTEAGEYGLAEALAELAAEDEPVEETAQEAVETPDVPEPGETPVDDDAELPEAYRGKSKAELIALLEAKPAPTEETKPEPVDEAAAKQQAEEAEWQQVISWGQGRAERAYARMLADHKRAFDAGLVETEQPDIEALQSAAWLEARDDYRDFKALAQGEAKAQTDTVQREIAPQRVATAIAPILERDIVPMLTKFGFAADAIAADAVAQAIVDAGLYEQWRDAPVESRTAYLKDMCSRWIAGEILAGNGGAVQPTPTEAPKRKAPPAQVPPDGLTDAPTREESVDSPALDAEMARMRQRFPSLADDADAIRELAADELRRKGRA